MAAKVTFRISITTPLTSFHKHYRYWLCNTLPDDFICILAYTKWVLYCIVLYCTVLSLKCSDMAHVTQGDHTVLPATHTWTIPAFTPQRQRVTALWLVHTAPTHKRDSQAELTWVAGYTPRQMPGTGNWTGTQSPIPVLTGPDVG